MEKLQFKKPRITASGIPTPLGGVGCMQSIIGIVIFASTLFFVACKGSRTDRIIKAIERTVDDYNNGDSSSLITLIDGVLALGVLRALGKWIDSKK